MTPDEIRRIADLIKASGRRNVPVPLSEWREFMTAKVKGKKPSKRTVKLTPLQKVIYEALTDRPESPGKIVLRSKKPLLKFASASRYCNQLAKLGMAIRHTDGQHVRWRKSDVKVEVV